MDVSMVECFTRLTNRCVHGGMLHQVDSLVRPAEESELDMTSQTGRSWGYIHCAVSRLVYHYKMPSFLLPFG